jgi:hypothetical protein
VILMIAFETISRWSAQIATASTQALKASERQLRAEVPSRADARWRCVSV